VCRRTILCNRIDKQNWHYIGARRGTPNLSISLSLARALVYNCSANRCTSTPTQGAHYSTRAHVHMQRT
jgi:hypothetical protein